MICQFPDNCGKICGGQIIERYETRGDDKKIYLDYVCEKCCHIQNLQPIVFERDNSQKELFEKQEEQMNLNLGRQ